MKWRVCALKLVYSIRLLCIQISTLFMTLTLPPITPLSDPGGANSELNPPPRLLMAVLVLVWSSQEPLLFSVAALATRI